MSITSIGLAPSYTSRFRREMPVPADGGGVADQVQLSGQTAVTAAPLAVVAPAASVLEEQKQIQQELALAAAGAAIPLFGIGGLLFPDSHGRIKHLALQLGNVEFNKPLPTETHDALIGVWNQLFTHMSPDTKFSVVCADQHGVDSVQQLVRDSHIAPERVKIFGANSKDGMSIWIRDSMLPTLDAQGNTKILVQDRTYWPGPDNSLVAPLLSNSYPNIYSQPHPALRIDGGNVVSNRHLSLVGPDSIEQMRDRLQELAQNPDNLEQMKAFYEKTTGQKPGEDLTQFWADMPKLTLASEFQRPIMELDAQPAFHIDMAVTPIGDKKFLVGDPRLAIDAFQKLSPDERARVNAEMVKAGAFKDDSDIIGKLCEVNSGADYQANYDKVAKNLTDAGFEVERIPSMIGLRTTWSLPYLTYNNCMMEVYNNDKGETVKNVYLPQYGCQPLDEWSRRVYEQNGYHVVPLQMSPISKLEGAIRCSSYALERDLIHS